jgi:hypothetical protein
MAAPASPANAGIGAYLRNEAIQFCLPHSAPVFLCPSCQCALHYEGSRSTSRSDSDIDLSDSYVCPAGCGNYEYERRTHRLRVTD